MSFRYRCEILHGCCRCTHVMSDCEHEVVLERMLRARPHLLCESVSMSRRVCKVADLLQVADVFSTCAELLQGCRCGRGRRTLVLIERAPSRKLSDSEHDQQRRQQQRSHAASTHTCARTRIDTDTVDLHTTGLPCYRCPPHRQWRLRTHTDPVFRKTFSTSSPRTSQRRKGWARKAVGSKEEWRYRSAETDIANGTWY